MKKRIVVWCLLFALMLPTGSVVTSGITVGAENRKEYIEGQIIIAVKEKEPRISLNSFTTDILESDNLWEQYGISNAKVIKEYEIKNQGYQGQELRGIETGESIRFYMGNYDTKNDIWDVIDEIEQEENVIKAEPNYVCHSFSEEKSGVPGSEGLTNQWYLDSIEAIEAWKNMENNEKIPGEGVVVAVIDTGVSIAHEGLQDKIWKNEREAQGEEGVDDDQNGYVDDIFGVNMANTFTNMTDSDGHGTMMSGIIGLSSANSEAVGVAYGAQIMPVKVSKDGNFGTDMAVEGIRYAVENGADIINMSFGTYYDSYLMQTAIREAAETCMLVAAAGNESTPTENDIYTEMEAADVYPASYRNVVGVMGMDPGDKIGTYSNWDANPGEGGEYEIVAPGTSIYSSTLKNRYDTTTGTSPATAIVSGALAIWRSLYPDQEKYPAAALQQLFLTTQKHTILYSPTPETELTYRKLNLMDMIEHAMSEEIVCDKQPPVIKDKTEEMFRAGAYVTFQAEVTDNISVQSTKVYFRQCGKKRWEQASMDKNEKTGLYEFTFLSDKENPGAMEYYFEACDGALYSLFGTEQQPQTRFLYQADVAELVTEQIMDQEYTGTALTPDVVIYDRERRLVNGKDYSLSYKDNIEKGTALVMVEGIGNYIGSFSTYFFIVKNEQAAKTPEPEKTPLVVRDEDVSVLPQTTPSVQAGGDQSVVAPVVTIAPGSVAVKKTDEKAKKIRVFRKKKVILRRTYINNRKKAKLQWKCKGYNVKKWYLYCSYGKKRKYKWMKKTNQCSIIVPCDKKKKYYAVVAVVVIGKKEYKSKRSEGKACVRF